MRFERRQSHVEVGLTGGAPQGVPQRGLACTRALAAAARRGGSPHLDAVYASARASPRARPPARRTRRQDPRGGGAKFWDRL